MPFARFLAATCFALFCAAATGQGRELPDFTRLVDDAGAAVVNIAASKAPRRPTALPGLEDEEAQEFLRRFIPRQQPAPGQRESRSVGSGFIVSSDGLIVTNQHVTAGADSIIVTLRDGTDLPARLLGEDARTDIAVLKVDTTGLPVAAIPTLSR